MTKYELLDLRATLGERLTNFVKFWLTITFGAFGAAYYGGTEFDLFSSIALLGFFAITSSLCGLAIEWNLAQLRDLASDVAALNSETSDKPIAALDLRLSRPKFLVRGVQGLIAFTFVGFCFYLFREIL